MAIEIVDAIEKAESNAQKMEEQAKAQCDEILQDARKQSAESVETKLKKAKQEAGELLADAKLKSGKYEQKTQTEIAAQTKLMRQTALRQQDEAIHLVLSEVI